ncbi:hypothetical protein ACSQ67_021250 [Phaseolus vulgaris]
MPNNTGELSSRSIITCKASLDHSRSIINNKRLNVLRNSHLLKPCANETRFAEELIRWWSKGRRSNSSRCEIEIG